MATAADATGWGLSSDFTPSGYGNQTLVSGLQAAALYDPTQGQSTGQDASTGQDVSSSSGATSTPTTANSTSAARSLGTGMSLVAQPTAGTLTTSAPSVATSYALPTAMNKLTVSSGTPLTSVAPNASQIQATQLAPSTTAYAGPAVVSAATGSAGDYAYYQWNAASNSYSYLGTYNPTTKQTRDWGGTPNLNIPGMSSTQVSADQSLVSQAQTLGSALTLPNTGMSTLGSTGASQVDTAEQGNINAYNTGKTTYAQNEAAGQAAQSDAETSAIQNYFNPQTSTANINGSTTMAPINTSVADAAGLAAQQAIASQYATNEGGADAGMANHLLGYAANNQAGANQVTHDTAAANSYNTNITAFNQALTDANSVDTATTGQQLQTDISSVQDAMQSLQQQTTQLNTSQQAQVNAQILQVQGQLQTYQTAVKQFGVGSYQAMALAKGAISAAGSIASLAV